MTTIAIAVPQDTYTLTGGNSPAGTPVTNLKTMQPTDVWQSSDLSGLNLVLDFGAAVELDVIALLFTNASAGATWRIRGATTEAGLTGTPGYDSGTGPLRAGTPGPDGRSHGLHFMTASQTFRWWRIDITDATNPDGFFRAGRLYATKAWTPQPGDSYGRARGFSYLSEFNQTLSGNTIVTERGAPIPRARFTLGFVSEEDMETNLFDLNARVGDARDVMVVFNPDRPEYLGNRIYYGLLRFESDIIHPSFGIFEQRLRIDGLV